MKSSKIIVWIFIVILLIVSVYVGIVFFNAKHITDKTHDEVSLNKDIHQEVDNYIETMTLEEKVGQLFVVGFPSKTLTENTKDFLSTYKIGGVLLLGYNLGNDASIIKLNNDLQNINKQYSDYPMFISVDQEGGVVSRLPQINSVAQQDIVTVEQARNLAKERGTSLKALGFNVNYSPVLDFITNQNSFLFDRVFSGDIEKRGGLALAMMQGYESSQIIPVPKHFPGHPDNKVDSHKNLPQSDIVKNEVLYKAQNFKQALSQYPFMMIMTGHVLYPKVDVDYPASLSYEFITEILRNNWGYDGVVITDDLEMGALQNNFSNVDIAKKAFLAGNDILLYSSTRNRQIEAYNALLGAVRSGEIDQARLNKSVKRILLLKYYLQQNYD